ncbi:hypothetical protein BC828DRAFT_404610 [Blastocladiella britannica]|nr:hypothetical protein BC828DRAFT_404610 [Blastocladiella britannica]
MTLDAIGLIDTRAILATAAQLKDAGNQHFKNRQSALAIRAYHEAIVHCLVLHNAMQPASSEELDKRTLDPGAQSISTKTTREAIALMVACYSNLAACHVGAQAWERVIQCTSKALLLDKSHAKCLNRRGIAHQALGDNLLAKCDFEAAVALNPKGIYNREWAMHS